MLAKLARAMPEGEGWLYEPKWDGFRTLVFRDGDEVYLQSRDEKPLNRYFPELLRSAPGAAAGARRCWTARSSSPAPSGLDFEALLQRIHPAASRVAMLAEQTPASVVFWDLLALGDEDLRPAAFSLRRQRAGRARWGRRRPAGPSHPRDPRPGDWPSTGSRASRAPGWTA